MEEVQNMIDHSHLILEEKAELVHKLNNTIVQKVSNFEKVNEMKDLGKREAEIKYKEIIEQKDIQHK